MGCDWEIDSDAREDRCGICHGDGTACKTVLDQFNKTEGLGYESAITIPIGARNIRVEEVRACIFIPCKVSTEVQKHLSLALG